MSVRLVIPGKPVALERARRGQHGNWYLPQRSRTYREQVQAEWMAAGRPTIEGPFALRVEVHCNGRRFDTDNALKGYADSLNGLAWPDDRAMVKADVEHVLDRQEYAVIEAHPAEQRSAA